MDRWTSQSGCWGDGQSAAGCCDPVPAVSAAAPAVAALPLGYVSLVGRSSLAVELAVSHVPLPLASAPWPQSCVGLWVPPGPRAASIESPSGENPLTGDAPRAGTGDVGRAEGCCWPRHVTLHLGFRGGLGLEHIGFPYWPWKCCRPSLFMITSAARKLPLGLCPANIREWLRFRLAAARSVCHISCETACSNRTEGRCPAGMRALSKFAEPWLSALAALWRRELGSHGLERVGLRKKTRRVSTIQS